MKKPNWKIVYWTCVLGTLLLIALGMAWELWLAPLHETGSMLVLKVLPLTVLIAGLLKRHQKSYQILSLLIWLYVLEGLVRLTSDTNPTSRILSILEFILALGVFVSLALYLRWTAPQQQAPDKASA